MALAKVQKKATTPAKAPAKPAAAPVKAAAKPAAAPAKPAAAPIQSAFGTPKSLAVDWNQHGNFGTPPYLGPGGAGDTPVQRARLVNGAPFNGVDILAMEARDPVKAREMTREQNAWSQTQPGGWNEQQLQDYYARQGEIARANVGTSYQDRNGAGPAQQMINSGQRFLADTPENRAAFDALPDWARNSNDAYLAKKSGKILNPEYLKTKLGNDQLKWNRERQFDSVGYSPNADVQARQNARVDSLRAGLGMPPNTAGYPTAANWNTEPPTTNPSPRYPLAAPTAAQASVMPGGGPGAQLEMPKGQGAYRSFGGGFPGGPSGAGDWSGHARSGVPQASGMAQANEGPPPLTPGPTVPGGNQNIPSSMGGAMPWGQAQNGPRQRPVMQTGSPEWQREQQQLQATQANQWQTGVDYANQQKDQADAEWRAQHPGQPKEAENFPWNPPAQWPNPGAGGNPSTGPVNPQAKQLGSGSSYNPNQNAAYNNTARQRFAGMAQQASQGAPNYTPPPQAPAPTPQAAPQAPSMPQSGRMPSPQSGSNDNWTGGNWATGGGSWTNQAGGFGMGGRSPFGGFGGNPLQMLGGVQRLGDGGPGGWNGPQPANSPGTKSDVYTMSPEEVARHQARLASPEYQAQLQAQQQATAQRVSEIEAWRQSGADPSSLAPTMGARLRGFAGDFGAFVPGMGMRSGMKPQQPRTGGLSEYAPQAPEQSVTMPRTVGTNPMEQAPSLAPSVMPNPMQYTF